VKTQTMTVGPIIIDNHYQLRKITTMRTIMFSAIACLTFVATSAFADDDNQVQTQPVDEVSPVPAPEPPASEPVNPQTPPALDVPPKENAMAEHPVCTNPVSITPCYLSNGFLLERPVASEKNERFRFLGMGFSIGVPSGLALGLVGRIPKINFLKLELDGTYNGLAPGMKGSLTFDPIKFPIAPTLTVDAGGNWGGQVPGATNSPTISYQYADALLGLEMGSRDAFRFYLRGGLTHVWANASGLQKTFNNNDKSLSIGDVSLSASAAPAAQIGFQWLF
jgi:hypothetical protein